MRIRVIGVCKEAYYFNEFIFINHVYCLALRELLRLNFSEENNVATSLPCN